MNSRYIKKAYRISKRISGLRDLLIDIDKNKFEIVKVEEAVTSYLQIGDFLANWYALFGFFPGIDLTEKMKSQLRISAEKEIRRLEIIIMEMISLKI